MERSECARLIREIRINNCLTQDAFALELRVTPVTVSRYERALQQPSLKRLVDIIHIAKSVGMELMPADFDLQPSKVRASWKLKK